MKHAALFYQDTIFDGDYNQVDGASVSVTIYFETSEDISTEEGRAAAEKQATELLTCVLGDEPGAWRSYKLKEML